VILLCFANVLTQPCLRCATETLGISPATHLCHVSVCFVQPVPSPYFTYSTHACLQAVALVPKDFNKTLIRSRTKIFYKQQKFNLCHEESEGFSKLLVELNQDHASVGTSQDQLSHNIQTLIGSFEVGHPFGRGRLAP